jgi:hypothetical protein
MFTEISVLRWIAISIGILFVVSGVWWGRRRGRGGASPAIIFVLGLALFVIGVFPGIARAPSELLFLGNMQGGGIITVLILSTVFLWLALVWNRSKIEYLRDRLNDLLNAQAIDGFLNQPVSQNADPSSIWVVIPAFEEEANISAVLSDMPETTFGRGVQVLVVDDGSADATARVAASAGAHVLRMPINSGQGSALRAGYAAALRLGAEAVVTLDADGQNAPSEVEVLAEPVLTCEADVVIGSRLLGEFEQSGIARTVGVHAFNWLLTVLTGTKITDCASSFRALSRRVLEAAELRQEQYQSTEILIEAARKGFTITERPITWRRRLTGTTKKGRNVKYGFLFLRTILKTWLR